MILLPPPGAIPRISRRHPLAPALVALYLPGRSPFDLCGQGPALLSRQNWVPAPTPYGQGGTGGSAPNSAAAWATLPAALRLPGPISLYFLGVQLAQPTGVSDYFGFTATGTPSGSQTTAIRLYDGGSGGAVTLKWQDTSGTLHTVSGGSTPAVGARISVLGTVVIGGNGTLYRNGAQIAQAAGSALNIEYSTPSLFVGAAQSTEYGANRSVLCAVWRRALSAAEAAALDAASLADPMGLGGLLEWPWDRVPHRRITGPNLTSDRLMPFGTAAVTRSDIDAALESGIGTAGTVTDRLIAIEAIASVATDGRAPAEAGERIVTDRQAVAEAAASVRTDRPARAEAGMLLAPRGLSAPSEGGAATETDMPPPAENLASPASDRAAAIEILLTARRDRASPIEVVALFRADLPLPDEMGGAAVYVSDSMGTIEGARRLVGEVPAPAESTGSAAGATRDQGLPIETLISAKRDGGAAEWTLWQQTDWPGAVESGSLLVGVRLFAGEGAARLAREAPPLGIEPGGVAARDETMPIEQSSIGSASLLPLEWPVLLGADLPMPFAPVAAGTGGGGPTADWLQSLGIATSQLFHAEARVSTPAPLLFVLRARLCTASASLARPRAFTPLAPGASDNFAFDFTAAAGDASIVAAIWSCTLRPYQTVSDPAPQTHLLRQSVETRVATEMRSDFPVWPGPVAVMIEGAFAVALVGGFAPAQAAALYVLSATVTLSDGRTLSLSADLPISPT